MVEKKIIIEKKEGGWHIKTSLNNMSLIDKVEVLMCLSDINDSMLKNLGDTSLVLSKATKELKERLGDEDEDLDVEGVSNIFSTLINSEVTKDD